VFPPLSISEILRAVLRWSSIRGGGLDVLDLNDPLLDLRVGQEVAVLGAAGIRHAGLVAVARAERDDVQLDEAVRTPKRRSSRSSCRQSRGNTRLSYS
jgi:hypothetical protein